MPTATININEQIAEHIRVRYAEISDRSFGFSNVVVDAYYPTYVRNSLLGLGEANVNGKRCSAISPFIAQELGVYQIQIEDLTKMLGFKKQDIKAILEGVKSKGLSLCLVGFGGTGTNFAHWAKELCNFTNTVNIFKGLSIFDNDYVELTNLFRFPSVDTPTGMFGGRTRLIRKVQLISSQSVLSETSIYKSTDYINPSYLSSGVAEFDSNGTPIKLKLANRHKNTVFYGAPDIKTRELFSMFDDLQFVSGTHGNDDCQLFIKPEQDSSMQIESYGMINLSVFFMNQIKMTIEFLRLLASDEDLTKSKLVMEYSFSKEYANKRLSLSGLNRTYNFPINANNFLDQESNLSEPEFAQQDNDQESNQEDLNVSNEADLSDVAIPMPPPAPPVPPVDPDSMEREVAIGDLDRTIQTILGTDPATIIDELHHLLEEQTFTQEPQIEEAQQAPTPAPTRRRRRTRAEIDADNAAAANLASNVSDEIVQI